MRILTFSIKGGVSKSSISYSLFQMLDNFQVITNDKGNGYNIVIPDDMYYLIPDGAEIPIFDDKNNIIYDMGGYPDPRLKQFIEKNPSMIILIPFLPDLLSFQSALKTYNEIKGLGNENIIFIISRTKKGDYELFSNQIKEMGINKAVLELKESKLFQNMWNKKESIKQVRENKLLKHSYKEVLNQLEILKEEVMK